MRTQAVAVVVLVLSSIAGRAVVRAEPARPAVVKETPSAAVTAEAPTAPATHLPPPAVVASTAATATLAAEPSAAAATAPGEPSPFTAEYVAQMRTRSGRVSCGFSFGFGGVGSSMGLQCNIPTFFIDQSDVTFRIISRWNHGDFSAGFYDPIWYNGALIILRSPLVFGLFRFYGGGGGWMGWRPLPVEHNSTCRRPDGACALDQTVSFSGGGFSGIEFFDSVRGYFIEIGAQGAAHPSRMDGGLYLYAGSNFFF